jgi:hypothetical protein
LIPQRKGFGGERICAVIFLCSLHSFSFSSIIFFSFSLSFFFSSFFFFSSSLSFRIDIPLSSDSLIGTRKEVSASCAFAVDWREPGEESVGSKGLFSSINSSIVFMSSLKERGSFCKEMNISIAKT